MKTDRDDEVQELNFGYFLGQPEPEIEDDTLIVTLENVLPTTAITPSREDLKFLGYDPRNFGYKA